MMNLAVMFGGKSCEHDVSVVTGLQAVENADQSKYHVIPVYITRDGVWYTGEKLKDVKFIQAFDPAKAERIYIEPVPGGMLRYIDGGGLFSKKSAVKIDAAILAFHGMNGEDGTVQGLLELAGIPYSSSGVLGSAVGMDKIAMRLCFKGMGLPVLPFQFYDRRYWSDNRESAADEIEKVLRYPLFVKPSNLGSSIGISRAENRQALMQAMDVAFHYDRRVIVENGVSDIMEVNCSVLGWGSSVEASVCEQPVTWETFLTFDEKYLRGKGTKGMKSLSRIVPAPIPEDLTHRIQEMSKQVFMALDCKGTVRIDYIIDKGENLLYINEINTIPGSLAFYLWEESGVKFPALIDRLVALAKQAMNDRLGNDYAYNSDILSKFKSGGSIKK